MSTGIQALLLLAICLFANCEWLLGTCMIQRPLVLGLLTGLAMGDIKQGIIMGATMELAFAGAVSIGAYDPPDTVSATVLGVALAIKAGGGVALALTIGIPVASVVLAISNVTGYPILQLFAHAMDRNIAKGNDKAFQRNYILSGLIAWGITAPIVPLAFYFGADKVEGLVNYIPEFVQTGMEIAGGLLPAMGFALLAGTIWRKDIAPFFFIGYFIVAYTGVSTTGVSLFAILILVALYFMTNSENSPFISHKKETVAVEEKTEAGGDFDEF